MTIRYACDGPDCPVVMAEHDPRIELSVVSPEPPEGLDPELLDGDITGVALSIEMPLFGFTATHHFHQPACLASWAMARHLNESDTAP